MTYRQRVESSSNGELLYGCWHSRETCRWWPDTTDMKSELRDRRGRRLYHYFGKPVSIFELQSKPAKGQLCPFCARSV